MNTITTSNVGIVSGNNVSRNTDWFNVTEKGEQKELGALGLSLSEGYKVEYGGLIGVHKATEEEQAQAVEELRARSLEIASMDTMKIDGPNGKIEVQNIHVEKAFQLTHMDKGEIVPPEYIVDYGYRRTYALLIANAILIALNGIDAELITEIPIHDLSDLTADERKAVCITENTKKREGQKVLTAVDKLSAMKWAYYTTQAKEADFLRLFFKPNQRGQAQKYYGIFKIDAKLGGVVDSIINGDLDANVFNSHKDRKAILDGESTIEQVIAEKKEGNEPKMMSKADIKDWAERHPDQNIKDVLKAVISNDGTWFQNKAAEALA